VAERLLQGQVGEGRALSLEERAGSRGEMPTSGAMPASMMALLK
jgi:hypothetical protein